MSSFDSTLGNLGITRSNAAAPVSSSASTTLGQADFLKLMTAQMQNQDPFNPVDNTQMVAQMAQFSSLAGISEMSTTLKAIADKLNGTSTADALSYVGHSVLTAGDTAFGRTTSGIAGAIELGADASDVTISIAGADGQVLKTMSLGKSSSGTISYDWDGKTANGEDSGAGPFTITVLAQNDGRAVPATGLVWAPVQSVSNATGSPVLTLPGIGDVPASAVRRVG